MKPALLALLLALPAHAAEWRVVRADPITVCEPAAPTAYAATPTASGLVYDVPKPVCRVEIATKARSYYLVADELIDSQQAIPENTPCEFARGRFVRGGFTYGRFAGGGILWARCAP